MNVEGFINIVKGIHGKNEVPLHAPFFRGNEIDYLTNTIQSSFVSSVGEYVTKLESTICKFTGSKFAIATNTGTSALHTSLILAGVKKDNEVLTQALSFVATSNAISYIGASPVFVDVDYDTMGMSPDALENFLQEFGEIREKGTFNKKSGKMISACLPMHTFGFVCRINKIRSICEKWNINLVEDAAEALGSKRNHKSAGTFGDISAVSFNGNKIITSGGGGMIFTQNKNIAIEAKHLTTTAKVNHDWEYIHDRIGFNYRMPNLNAALAYAQLEKIEKIISLKKSLYNDYLKELKSSNFKLIEIPRDTEWNYWLFSVSLDNKTDRDDFLRKTNKMGVSTRPIWKLLFRLPMFNNCQRDSQKNAIKLESKIVNIPSNI